MTEILPAKLNKYLLQSFKFYRLMLEKWTNKRELEIYLVFGGIFVLFLCLRVFALNNTVLLDDLSSVGYLEEMKLIAHGDLEGYINSDPEDTPGYGIFGALFSLPGWGVETGARLASLFFSCLVFLTLLGIGKHMARPWEVAFGLLLLSLSPTLISESFGVISEPTYLGLIYLGWWLFWGQYKDPTRWKAALLGITFGFAFLTRMEGILYLFFIPVLQGVCTYWVGRNTRSLKHLISWSLIYVLCFGAMAAPQIWRVSEKMGTFAINGRQIWVALLTNPDGKSYSEKIRGLDFSPSEINIEYLRTHPKDLPPGAKSLNLYAHVHKVIWNLSVLHQNVLGTLLGPLCLIAFAFGLLSLYQSGKFIEAFFVLAFLALSLVGPLMHNVYLRHVLILAPMVCLVAGIGVVYASEALIGKYEKNFGAQYVLSAFFLFAMLITWAVPLRDTFKPADYNRDYSLGEFREHLGILKSAANELGRMPVVLAERGYITYFLGGKRLFLPYTDYQGLVKYSEFNGVDFLYFNHRKIGEFKFPYLDDFISGRALTNFALLYSGVDAYGEKVELYRFRKSKA